jgi:multicomponent Na+:H+ antiporter subunit A
MLAIILSINDYIFGGRMLLWLVILPFIAATILAAVGKKLNKNVGLAAFVLPVFLFACFVSHVPAVLNGNIPSFFYEWVPSVGLNLSLSLDGLSMLFVLLITGVGALVILYAHFYLNPTERLTNFYVFLLLFMGAMLGTVTADNLILIYLFWEVTSVSSFLLIGFWYHRELSVQGAQKSLLITVAGSLCMLMGFLMLWKITDSFEVVDILGKADLVKASPLYAAIVVLILLGAFAKSAQMPFHIWLPGAMEAPTPVSCYLHSATMVKAGIYLIARLTGILGGSALWFGIISFVGISSLVYGSYKALRQTDLKSILAFSTISQLGLIVALLGFGTNAAIAAALFHLLNHSVFKGSLFLVTGMVDHSTGTRDITKLRGLASVMPITAAFCGMGAMAMAGLPPFNGFLSKELFFENSLETVSANLAFLGDAAWLFPALAVVGSIFTFAYSLAIFLKVFFSGKLAGNLPQKPHEASLGMLLPTGIIASFTLLIALSPKFFAKTLLNPAINAVTGEPADLYISFWHGFNVPLFMTIAAVGVGLLLYWRIDLLRKLLNKLPSLPGADAFYNWFIPQGGMTEGAKLLTNSYMTGHLRDYIVYILLFFLLITGGTLAIFWSNSLISFADLAPVNVFEVTLAFTVIVAAIAVAVSSERLPAILALGAVGYGVALFFIFFRAPDLALTQLLVETVLLLLFLLAFRHLPFCLREKSPQFFSRIKVVKLLVSGGVGVLTFLLTMVSHSNKFFDSICWYYIQNSKELAGGKNIVNVILVDFRGLDTMGEIAVLGLAALGVFALIHLGRSDSSKKEAQ